MKKLLATICVIGSAFALNACETDGSGHVDTAAPYSQSRTAGAEEEAAVRSRPAPARAERTFSASQSK